MIEEEVYHFSAGIRDDTQGGRWGQATISVQDGSPNETCAEQHGGELTECRPIHFLMPHRF